MKVIVLENFRIYAAAEPGQPERRIDYSKGMVLDDVDDGVAESWISKGLVKSASPRATDLTEPAADWSR